MDVMLNDGTMASVRWAVDGGHVTFCIIEPDAEGEPAAPVWFVMSEPAARELGGVIRTVCPDEVGTTE